MLAYFIVFPFRSVIRINVPPLTEDRRKALVKQAKVVSEDGKVAIRNIRRDAVDGIKKIEKQISKDESAQYQDDLQKLTDEFVKKLDVMTKKKETDLMKLWSLVQYCIVFTAKIYLSNYLRSIHII